MKTSGYTKCVPVMNTNVFGSFFVLNYKFNTDFFPIRLLKEMIHTSVILNIYLYTNNKILQYGKISIYNF